MVVKQGSFGVRLVLEIQKKVSNLMNTLFIEYCIKLSCDNQFLNLLNLVAEYLIRFDEVRNVLARV